MPGLHISSHFDAGAIEVISLTDPQDIQLYLRRDNASDVDLNLDAHGDEGLPYNFCVGTEDTPGYTPRLAALADAFRASWLAASPDFQTTHGYPRGKHGDANMTLATNWIGQQFDCLAFTIEMPFKDNADLPDVRVSWNGERSKHLGASVLLPLLAVVDQLRV